MSLINTSAVRSAVSPVPIATLEATAYAVSFAFTSLQTAAPTFPPLLCFRPLETDAKNPSPLPVKGNKRPNEGSDYFTNAQTIRPA